MAEHSKPLDKHLGQRLSGVRLSSFARPQAPSKKPIQRAPAKRAGAPGPKQKPVAVNVKILKQQQDWLRDTAQDIRDNNDEAVPACDRVYPQHLIQVAIDMLKAANVDWAEIRNVEELRQRLNL